MMKLFRTVQTNFPFLLDFKFAVMRRYRLWRNRPFEADFEALSLIRAPENSLYLDVGANRGQSTDAILMKAGKVQIQQFEPNPLLSEKLVKQYSHYSNIKTNPFGLGDVSTELTFYVPFYKKWMFDGLASFDQASARDWLKDRLYFYKDRHLTLREAKCQIRQLDGLGLKPFFMKLDIQGYEFAALKGSEDTLKKYEPILLIESPTDEEMLKYLSGLGYEKYAFRDGRFVKGEFGSLNTFFMTDSKAKLVQT